MVMAHCGMSLIHGRARTTTGDGGAQAAVEANPNNLMVVARAGVAHLHCGSLEDALAYFHRANRLSPGDPGAHFSLCGIAHVQLILGDYPEALVWAARAWRSTRTSTRRSGC